MGESRCRIVQCLCPQRHCIIALPYEGPRSNPFFVDATRGAVQKAIADGAINPKCELCGAGPDQWVYEDRETKYRTMAEAMPHLRATERAQIETREFMKASRN